jgi:hypothetical protein
MNGRRRAGEIVDFIDFDKKWHCYVMAEKLKSSIIEEVGDIAPGPCEKVVKTQHFVTLHEEALT